MNIVDLHGLSLPFFEKMSESGSKISRICQGATGRGGTTPEGHKRGCTLWAEWIGLWGIDAARCSSLQFFVDQPDMYALVSSSFCFHVMDLGETSVAG